MSAAASTHCARAWAVTRADGFRLGFTDHDVALSFDGTTFRPESGMSAKAVVQSSGLSVDNSEAAGVLSDDAITEADLMAGRWDGAELQLWEVDWTDTANRRALFRGHLGEITREGAGFRAEMRGLAEGLNRPNGRVFHRRCSAVLGDAACAVNLDAPGYRAEVEIAEVLEDGARLITVPLAGYDDGWFERGTLALLSGAGAGLSAVVKRDVARADGRRALELWSAIAAPLAPGDRVRLTAGCDRRHETCRLKFSNYLNFRGFPHLPSEDWLTAPSAAADRVGPVRVNDGGWTGP